MAIEVFTTDQVNRLKEAIALGALTVEYADKKVTYRSLNDMIRTLEIMQNEIAGGAENCNDGKIFTETSKGIYE